MTLTAKSANVSNYELISSVHLMGSDHALMAESEALLVGLQKCLCYVHIL